MLHTLWHQVDCRDVAWPRAMRDLCQVRRRARIGDFIEVVSNPLVTPDKVKSWCATMGDNLVRTERGAGVFVAQIQIAGAGAGCTAKPYR